VMVPKGHQVRRNGEKGRKEHGKRYKAALRHGEPWGAMRPSTERKRSGGERRTVPRKKARKKHAKEKRSPQTNETKRLGSI